MKIAIVCEVLGKPNNGTTIATMNLIDYLKSRGHEVIVISCDRTKEGQEGYVVLPKLLLGPIAKRAVKRNNVELGRPQKSIIVKAIKDVDVVHFQMPLLVSTISMSTVRKLDKPITASFHCQAENITAHFGKALGSKKINDATYRFFYKHVYKYCDKVHYPTEFIRRVFEERVGKTNAVVISNGVNDVFFKEIPAKRVSDKFTIICMGRLSNEKAQWTLLKAIPLTKHKDDIKVILAGDGPRKPLLKKIIEEEKIDAEINFYNREELCSMLRGADLYVHTARMEIESIACLEAIVSGLVPVICDSDKSATREFALDENNLYKDNDEKALAEKIDFWYEHRELLADYSKRYESMRNVCGQEECMKRMEKMLLSAIEEHKNKKAE